MVGTIFEKSSTPLMLWFHAVMVFSNAKSGISAKQMERYLAVTYKCAWRILGQIRSALAQFGERLQGDVETDGAYFGGRKSAGRNNEYLSEAFKAKTLVLGAMQRGGAMRASVVSNMKAVTVTDFIQEYVERSGTRLMTDGSRSYERVAHSYKRQAVDHHRGEYVRGDIHVNSMENFWSHAKRSFVGTHKRISKKHAQSYINAFVFHYNNRYNDRKRFLTLLGVVLHVAKKKETEIES
jgi:transposase